MYTLSVNIDYCLLFLYTYTWFKSFCGTELHRPLTREVYFRQPFGYDQAKYLYLSMAYPGEVDTALDTALLHQEPAALQLSHVPPTLNMDDDHDSLMCQPSFIKNMKLYSCLTLSHVLPLNMHLLPEDEPSHTPRPRSVPPTFLPGNPPREVPGLMEDGEHVHVHDAVIRGHMKAVDFWVKCLEDFMYFLDTCGRLYEDIPPEMRTRVSSLLEALHQKSLIGRQSRAIASIIH